MTIHPMISLDLHDGIPPPGPVMVPKLPHFVAAMEKWALPTSKPALKVLGVGGFPLMQMGTDIGNFIPHIFVEYLAPLYTATSGSKSMFGASTVQSQGSPTAAAIVVVMNLNLNCWSPVPIPLGYVCAPNTVMVGMTLGDILGGLCAMAMDMLIQYALNKAFSSGVMTRFFNRLQGPIIRALIPNAPRFTTLTTALFGQSGRILSNPWVANTLGNLLPNLVATGFGSPLGWSHEKSPGGAASNFLEDQARGVGQVTGDSITNLFNSPTTPEYPSVSPDPGAAPPIDQPAGVP